MHRGKHSWEEELQWLIYNWTPNAFISQIKRLALAVTVYKIWKERNAVIYKNQQTSEAAIIASIMEKVRNVAIRWKKIPRKKENWEQVIEWGISPNCLAS